MSDIQAETPIQNTSQTAPPEPLTTRAERPDTDHLFRKLAGTRSEHYRAQLVDLHLNLVRFLAGKFATRGEPLEDLIQVGTIGLINAIDRFDPDRGIKFSTYATPTIVGEIRRYFRDKAWSLKVPRRLQELSLAASKARNALNGTLGRAPTVAELAKHLSVTEEEVLQALDIGIAYETVSLDSPAPSDSDQQGASLMDSIGSVDVSLERMIAYGDLDQALGSLDPRERAVISLRFFKEMSQADVAEMLNVSQMHVSRLQRQALIKLKSSINRGK